MKDDELQSQIVLVRWPIPSVADHLPEAEFGQSESRGVGCRNRGEGPIPDQDAPAKFRASPRDLVNKRVSATPRAFIIPWR
jgi:hypothetical protein